MAEKKEDGIVETIKTVFWALLIAGIFRTLFFQPFFIPSSSMKDTLLIGDFLFVNKMAYGYSKYSCPFSACPIPGRLFGSEPERGDVVAVFTVPEGEYFFMGDNRDNSTDSRVAQSAGGVGFVPEEYLLGRADRIMFSAAGKRLLYFWTWRSDRFFKAIE